MSERGYSTLEGELRADNLRFAIVVGRFNSFITERLLEGAIDAIIRCGGKLADVEVIRIPGSWEFPVTVRAVAAAKRHDAILCLGAVIRGDTPHFEYVAGEAARGLQLAGLETGVPVAFGVLTVNTPEQALERAATGAGNKGGEAMESALEMAAVMARL